MMGCEAQSQNRRVQEELEEVDLEFLWEAGEVVLSCGGFGWCEVLTGRKGR